MIKNFIAAFCVAVLTTSFLSAELVNPFDGMKDYNVMVFGDFHQKGPGDTEGFLAVSNNFTTDGAYGVGHNAQNRGSDAVALVVGGHLQTNSAWEVRNGNAYYATGSSKSPAYNGEPINYSNGAGKRVSSHSVDFNSTYTQMQHYSSQLSQLTATASLVQQWGNNYIDVGSGLQIVNINLDSLLYGSNGVQNLNNLQINAKSDTTLVINIFGGELFSDLAMANGFNVNGMSYDNLMFNFVDVDALSIMNMQFYGSILGVDTELTVGNANINGYTAIGDVIGLSGGEFHNNSYFDGEIDLPPATSVTPEPATMLIFAFGFALIPLAAYRMRKRTASSIIGIA